MALGTRQTVLLALGLVVLVAILATGTWVAYVLTHARNLSGATLFVESDPHPRPGARILDVTDADLATFPAPAAHAFRDAAENGTAHADLDEREKLAWEDALAHLLAARGRSDDLGYAGRAFRTSLEEP